MGLFSISFSAFPLLVYRKATEFCMLIFYSATLLEMFIRPKYFLMESVRYLKHSTISPANKENLSFPYPICILFIFFSYYTLVKNSGSMLNMSGEKRHVCLTPDFTQIYNFYLHQYNDGMPCLYLLRYYVMFSFKFFCVQLSLLIYICWTTLVSL
jgi:hypothetical protein